MQGRITAVVLIMMLSARATTSFAGLIVDPPLSITHRVTVQIIETALDSGESPATAFGSSSQRADIEAKVDSIWAQAGIDIAFLPTVTRFDNTFAYEGVVGGKRPQSDLNAILLAGQSAGVAHSDPSVINTYFVNVVPGFEALSENSVAGLAQIGDNGIAQYVGDNVLKSSANRDVVAQVVAHEIGHNLGLRHVGSDQPNLMSPDGTTQQLSDAQIAAIFETTRRSDFVAFIPSGGTGFPQLLDVAPIAGDYNDDGAVDAADYTVWRDNFGSADNLAADGNGNQLVDSGDFQVWKTNFSRSAELGHAVTASVPEPTALLQLMSAVFIGIVSRYRGARQA